MKLKNISIAILVILIGIGFTSCEEDRWVRGTLIYDSYKWEYPMLLESNGVLVTEEIRLDMRDIYTSGYGRILNIRVFDSFFLFSSSQFRPGDRMELRLESSTGRVYGAEMFNQGYNSVTRTGQFIVDLNDRNYAAFVDDLLYDLNRHGSVLLYIGGKSRNLRQNMDVHFEFNNNLDIEVRD